jgi:predicted lipoprotein with Yx(FWY)xxD motif
MRFASTMDADTTIGVAMSLNLRIIILVAGVCAAACRPTPEAPGISDDAVPTTVSSADDPGTGDPKAESAAASASNAEEAMVKAADASHGYLTDSANNALYFLEDNQNGEKCDAACQEAWPPVTASGGRTVAGEGAQPEMLKTSPLSGGRYHLSYNGHPLYRYAGDRGAGRATGHGVSDKWGKWHLMSVEGNAYRGELPPR